MMDIETVLEYVGYVFLVLSGFPLGFIFWRVIVPLLFPPFDLMPIMNR